MKARYSIPFNGDVQLVKSALETGVIKEVYFGGLHEQDASDYYPDQDKFGPGALNNLVILCKKHNVRTNLLCNSFTLFFQNFKSLFKAVHSINGLDAITLSDPLTISAFRKEFPGKEIQASVIMDLDSSSKVEAVLKMGISTVNLPMKLNRDAQSIRHIGRLKKRYPQLRLKLIANHFCASDCIFMPWHYMLGTLKSRGQEAGGIHGRIYPDACFNPAGTFSRLIRAPFIRPEDINYYVKHCRVDVFKLVFRDSPSRQLAQLYRAYFAGKFAGNLFELVDFKRRQHDLPKFYCDNAKFPKDFVRTVTSCDKNCHDCSYCKKVAKAVIRSK